MGNFLSTTSQPDLKQVKTLLEDSLEVTENMLEQVDEQTVKRQYGWNPDTPDLRDRSYLSLRMRIVPTDLPEQVDLRPQCPPVYDQGHLGSCTANAIAGAYQFDEIKQHNSDNFVPSRLFIYYNEREMEGNISSDSGAELRDGIKSIHKIGVCHESLWPYQIDHFTDQPTPNTYRDAKDHQGITYARLQPRLDELKHCLSEGYPFVFGFKVYSSFESPQVAQTGYMNMPLSEDMLEGGHAVMAVGYTPTHFIIRNSWGPKWGDQGYFYMPYEYITNPDLAQDFWTLRRVTSD